MIFIGVLQTSVGLQAIVILFMALWLPEPLRSCLKAFLVIQTTEGFGKSVKSIKSLNFILLPLPLEH